jgi:hypothetical protein
VFIFVTSDFRYIAGGLGTLVAGLLAYFAWAQWETPSSDAAGLPDSDAGSG